MRTDDTGVLLCIRVTTHPSSYQAPSSTTLKVPLPIGDTSSSESSLSSTELREAARYVSPPPRGKRAPPSSKALVPPAEPDRVTGSDDWSDDEAGPSSSVQSSPRTPSNKQATRISAAPFPTPPYSPTTRLRPRPQTSGSASGSPLHPSASPTSYPQQTGRASLSARREGPAYPGPSSSSRLATGLQSPLPSPSRAISRPASTGLTSSSNKRPRATEPGPSSSKRHRGY